MVHPLISVAQYLDFVVNLALAFGLGFQIPIVVVFLIAVGIVPARTLAAARKYVALAIALLAAIVTPTPDVGTMMLLAGPMYLLFETGLLLGRAIERRREAEAGSGS
jgi:sec-independent protein translocase protein TatC